MGEEVFGLAGFLGVDPEQFTLAELCHMVKGKEDRLWYHTATLCSVIANGYRDPKKKRKPFVPEDFYPRSGPKHSKVDVTVGIDILKKVFVDGRKPNQDQSGTGVHRYYGGPRTVPP